MYEMMNGSIPFNAIAMCLLLNIALVLAIAALIKYLIKSKCSCGCNCGYGCNCCGSNKQANCGTDSKDCCSK